MSTLAAAPAELALSALNMALQQRKPDDVIHHGDQGSQYASIAFGERCRKMGVRPSMGSVGDAYDNAMAESFFASLECELIGPPQLADQDRGAPGVVYLDRGLVQPAPAPQRVELPVADELRVAASQPITAARRTRVAHRRRLRGRRHAAGGQPCTRALRKD